MTNLPAEATRPDKTDKPYPVSNHEFLQTIYRDLPDGVRGMIVSSKGNPNQKSQGFWNATPYDEDTKTPDDHNNYFTLSTFFPNEKCEYKRQKKFFSGMCAVMLDDIGTKIIPDFLDLEPSWKIETSLGNYQYGYVLKTPIMDSKIADGLVNAVIAAGLCDPGAGGPCARLARLPIGINGKYDPNFQCKLKEWHPERAFTIEQLINGLGLDMTLAAKIQTKKQLARALHESDPIYLPCPQENRILAELKKRSLYKSPLGEGKHDITCPWCHEHTDEADGGTAYFEPDSTFPIGGFHCFHGHCKERDIHTLLDHLGLSTADTRTKPTIRLTQGEMHHIVECAEKELAITGRYFQRGSTISTVKHDPTTHETTIKPLPRGALVSVLSSVAVWEKFDGRATGRIKCDPSERVCMALDGAEEYKHLPVLNGIAHQPYLREDGSLATISGYDAATGMYGSFRAEDFLVSEHPTEAQARKALSQLQSLIEEFPFKEESDRSAALSAMLTAVIRPSLSLAPMFHVKAPQIGSGKSYLCRIFGGFSSSQIGTPTTFPHDDEECRKLLLAEFMRGVSVIEFDNLTGDLLAHKSLCSALTSEYMTGRILGVSKTVTVSTRTLFLSSGNNVGPVQDMARRCITINLDPACEVPAARTFKNPDPLSMLHQRREEYVSYALTIIMAWIVAGRPKSECRTVASYSAWSELCRQPLLWLGLPDPTHSLFNTIMDDPDRELLGRLLKIWRDLCGNAPTKIAAFVLAASGNEFADDDVLTEIAGERNGINNTRLGRWIKRNERKVVNGLRFTRASASTNTVLWRVEEVK